MNPIQQFEHDLRANTRALIARWHKIDLHNHTPNSYDYQYGGSDAAHRTADQIADSKISVIIFTDHERLPDPQFISDVSTQLKERKHRALILSGVELNVFVEGVDPETGKYSDRYHFYHMLIGFDPGVRTPDFWLETIYHQCSEIKVQIGGREARGITAPISQLRKCLEDANALIIPAHLHTVSDLNTSRSVDNLYSDSTFLRYARESFTALEVVNAKTAQFFDGNHDETEHLLKGCIRSSDSHKPEEIGRRSCYAQLGDLTYQDLKAALGLPWRLSLTEPTCPDAYIEGLHVEGAFLQSFWMEFSPHCNVLIGVKGSGKTSILEALRFVFGADVPSTRVDDVNAHLQSILGSTGHVTALIRRADGSRVLVSRSRTDPVFDVTFEDSRNVRLSSPDALHFVIQILGWHEIEQAASDVNVRRVYMDAIAGRANVRAFEDEAASTSAQIKDVHQAASLKYRSYTELDNEVSRLQELRNGLQSLTDQALVKLRDEYQNALEQIQALRDIVNGLQSVKVNVKGALSPAKTGPT